MTTMDAGNGGALKLTDEMRAAIRDALDAVYGHGKVNDEVVMTAGDQYVFAAGYRMGQRDMRERAATVCIAAIDCNPDNASYGWGCGESAAAIRSLPVEE